MNKALIASLFLSTTVAAQELVLTPQGLSFTVQCPWELLASTNPFGPWTMVREIPAGGSERPPPADSPMMFFRARSATFERAKPPVPTPERHPSLPSRDYVYFTHFSSDVRYEIGGSSSPYWYRHTELWAGGNLATYRYSTAGNDMCPAGGMVCFEYCAPDWNRRLMCADGCDISMYPGMAAEFSMWHVLANITNHTTLGGVRDTSEAAIRYGATIAIVGPTNKAFWVDIGIRAVEAVRDELCSEWYPDHEVDARELAMAGRKPHFLYGEWAFYQYLVHGGDQIDATPTPPPRPHYWFVEYCIERLR